MGCLEISDTKAKRDFYLLKLTRPSKSLDNMMTYFYRRKRKDVSGVGKLMKAFKAKVKARYTNLG